MPDYLFTNSDGSLSSSLDLSAAKPQRQEAYPGRAPRSDLATIANQEGAGHLRQVIEAIYGQESGGGSNPRTSTDGARGGMQIMPATFSRYARSGESIDSPDDNLRVGVRIIKSLADKFGNDPAKIATGYFSGPGNVSSGGGSAWVNDHADGNGKRVSSYVNDVIARMSPGSTVKKQSASLPDLSQYPKWGDVVSSDKFKAESPERQKYLQGAYFNDVLAPHIAADGLNVDEERKRFMAQPLPEKAGLVSKALSAVKQSLEEGFAAERKRGQAQWDKARGAPLMERADGQAAEGDESRTLPLSAEGRARLEAMYNAASAAQREAIAKQPTSAGAFFQAKNRAYAGRDRGNDLLKQAQTGASVTDRFDPRAEARTRLLAEQGMDYESAAAQAKRDIAFGVRPGTPIGSARPDNFDWKTEDRYKGVNPVVRAGVKGYEGFKQGALGVDQAIAELVGASDAARRFEKGASASMKTVEAMGDAPNAGQRTFENAVGSIAQQLPSLLAGAATGSEALVLSNMAVQSFGQEYAHGRSSRLTPQDAAKRAALFAAFEVAGEKFGLGNTLEALKLSAKGAPTKDLAAVLAKGMVKEVPGEELTTAGQFLVDKSDTFGLNKEAGLKEYLDQASDTLLTTIMQSGLMMGGAAGASAAARRLGASGTSTIFGNGSQVAPPSEPTRTEPSFQNFSPTHDEGAPAAATAPASAPALRQAIQPHPTSQLADAIVKDLAEASGVPLDMVLPAESAPTPQPPAGTHENAQPTGAPLPDVTKAEEAGQAELGHEPDTNAPDELREVALWIKASEGTITPVERAELDALQRESILRDQRAQAGGNEGDDVQAVYDVASIQRVDNPGAVETGGAFNRPRVDEGMAGQVESAPQREPAQKDDSLIAPESAPKTEREARERRGRIHAEMAAESAPLGRADQPLDAAPSVEAPLPRTERAAKAVRASGAPVDMLAFINRNGGIALSLKSDIDQDAKIPGLFRRNGRSLDSLAELLEQNGYIHQNDIESEGATSGGDLVVDMIQRAVGGERIYTPQGYEDAATRQAEMQHREHVRAQAKSFGINVVGKSAEELAEMVEAEVLRREQQEAAERSALINEGQSVEESLDQLVELFSANAPVVKWALERAGQIAKEPDASTRKASYDAMSNAIKALIDKHQSDLDYQDQQIEDSFNEHTAAARGDSQGPSGEARRNDAGAARAGSETRVGHDRHQGDESFALETQSGQDLAEKSARENDQALADKHTADVQRGGFTLDAQTGGFAPTMRQGADLFGGPSVADFQSSQERARQHIGQAPTIDLFAQPDVSKKTGKLSTSDGPAQNSARTEQLEDPVQAASIKSKPDQETKPAPIKASSESVAETKSADQRFADERAAAQSQQSIFDQPAPELHADTTGGNREVQAGESGNRPDARSQSGDEAARKPESGTGADAGSAKPAGVNHADDFAIRPVEITEHLIATGNIKALYKAAGVKTADAFGGLSMDQRSKAYAQYVENGGQPAPPATEAYNDKVARMEREALIRRLQSDATVRQASGKPFRTEASAKEFSARHELDDTHETAKVEAGYVLKRLPEARRPSVLKAIAERQANDPENQRQERAFARAGKIGAAASNAVTAYENGDTSIEQFEAALDAAEKVGAGETAANDAVTQADAIAPEQLDVELLPTTPEQAAQANEQEAKIGDMGRKVIVRKDTATPTGPRAKTANTDERPAWIRKYHVMQDKNGKWEIMEDVGSGRRKGMVKRVSYDRYATEQEAWDALPLVVAAKRHRAYSYTDKTGKQQYGIFRSITDRKRALVKGGFASANEAMEYIAANPVEMIEHKFPFPERPWLDKIERTGKDYRKGKNVTKQMFEDTFAPGAVVYGNWLLNGDDTVNADGQELSNFIYDSLRDLAETIGVPPKALFLNGELALGIGADGKGGKNSAAAHYDPNPGKVLINLTKIKGAGSAAHEWWHAVDHYFARQGGYKDSASVVAGDFPHNSKARPELVEAIKRVVDTMLFSTKSQTTDADVVKAGAQKRVDEAIKNLDYYARDLRSTLKEGRYNKGKKVATEAQLQQWDAMVERLKAGDMGEKAYIDNPSKMRGAMGFETGAVLRDMNALYKSVTGRSFLRQDPESTGRRLHWVVQSIKENLERTTAEQDETRTYKGRTDYYLEAKQIDNYRTGDYWSMPEELGARAFESYIFDKLTGTGSRSDYLVYAVENRHYAALDMKPYPEGGERQAINAAFDKLFETVQTKETDAGVAMFRRSAANANGAVAAVVVDDVTANGIVARFLAAFPGIKGEIHVVPDFAALPANVQQDARDQGSGEKDTKGALDHQTGSVFIVQSNHTSATDLEETVFHEALGHVGMRTLLGRGFVQGLNNLYAQFGGLEGLAKIARARGFDKQFGEYVRGVAQARGQNDKFTLAIAKAVLSEEVFAHAAEQRPKLLDRLKALVGMLRQNLRNLGFKGLAQYGETDLLWLLQRAKVRLKTGTAKAAQQIDEAVKIERGDAQIVEHVTGKGKTIAGVIRKDLTLAQAKEIDPYTFKKNGGFFIREKYLKPDQSGNEEAKFSVTNEHAPGSVMSMLKDGTIERMLIKASGGKKATDGKTPGQIARELFGNPNPKSTAEQVIEELNGQVKLGGRIHVVQSALDLPPKERSRVFSSSKRDIGLQGIYFSDTGHAYLIADNIEPGEAFPIMIHEAGVHAGLEALIGEKGMKNLSAQIKDWARTGAGEQGRIAKRAAARIPEGTNERHIDEELIAYFVTEAAKEGYGQPKPKESNAIERWFAKLWGMVRTALEKLDINPEALTVDDVVALARGALERVQATAKNERGEDQGMMRAVTAEPGAMPISQESMKLKGGGTTKGWEDSGPSKLDDFIHAIQDRHINLKRVQQAIAKTARIAEQFDAYTKESLFHGRVATRAHQFLDRELRPLLMDMKLKGVSLDELESFLWARHAKERNEQIRSINPDMQDGGAGLTDAQVDEYFAGQDVLDDEGDVVIKGLSQDAAHKKRIEDLAARVDSINKGTKQVLVQYGLESPDTVAAWESTYKHYVPLKREEMDGATSIGQGFSVKGSASKRAMGSSRRVEHILANLALQREAAITRGEKNRVALSLYGLAMQNPNPDFWQLDKAPSRRTIDPKTGLVTESVNPNYKNDPNVLVVRIGGKDRAIVFNRNDERAARMVESLKNLDVEQLNAICRAVGYVTRYFSSISTQYNPVFGMMNGIRDAGSAAINLTSTPLANHKAAVLSNIPSAIRAIWRIEHGKQVRSEFGQLYEDMKNDGGTTGYREAFRMAGDRARAIKEELRLMDAGFARKAASSVLEELDRYNTAIENATRLAAYKVAREKGMTREAAASLAKELTVNFNRKGKYGTFMGSLYAFFNASVQGNARLIGTLKGPAGKSVFLGGVMLGIIQALIASAGFDEDKWEDVSDSEKQRNFIVPTGNGDYIKIPLPLGFNLLPTIGRTVAETMIARGKNAGAKASDLFSALVDSANPLGSATALQTLSPTVFDIPAAIYENKNFAGTPIAREDANPSRPTPGFSRAKDASSQASRVLARWINAAAGGTDYTPGQIGSLIMSPTPDQIDYIFGALTGGVGREANKAYQFAERKIRGEDSPVRKIPVVGNFVGTTNDDMLVSARYWRNVRELGMLENEYKGRVRDGRDVSELESERPELSLVKVAGRMEDRISKMRRARHRVEFDGGLSELDRTSQLKEIDAEVINRQSDFNRMVKEAKRGRVGLDAVD